MLFSDSSISKILYIYLYKAIDVYSDRGTTFWLVLFVNNRDFQLETVRFFALVMKTFSPYTYSTSWECSSSSTFDLFSNQFLDKVYSTSSSRPSMLVYIYRTPVKRFSRYTGVYSSWKGRLCTLFQPLHMMCPLCPPSQATYPGKKTADLLG